MNFEEFKTKALRTEKVPEIIDVNPDFMALNLSLAMQVANLLDLIKKKAIYGKPLDEEKFREHLQITRAAVDMLEDILPYAAETSEELDLGIRKIDAKRPEVTDERWAVKDFPVRVTHGIVGNFTEAGELIEALLDAAVENRPIDKTNVSEEFADQDWYKAVTFDDLGLSEEESRQRVIAKLEIRYKEGFSKDAALNRDLQSERQALEGKEAQ